MLDTDLKLDVTTETEQNVPESARAWPQQAWNEQNWPEAAARWGVLRKAYPLDPLPWFQEIGAYINAGDLDQAGHALSFAKQRFPSHVQCFTHHAAIEIRKANFKQAEALVNEAQAQHPNNLHTWMVTAELSEYRGDLEQASRYYLKAAECAREVPLPLIQHAEVWMRAGQWGRSESCWEIVRAKFPHLPAGYIRGAEAARLAGDPKRARKLMLMHQGKLDVESAEPLPEIKREPRGAKTRLNLFLSLVWTKAILSLRSEVHRNYLSYGWWVIEPLMHMLVYYLVFSLLLNRGGDNYAIFLLTGLIPWMWFMKAVTASSTSILAGRYLLLEVSLPSITFPLVQVVQASLKQIPIFLLLLVFVWLSGYSPSFYWWLLVPIILVQITITLCFSCVVAAVIPFVRDLSFLVPTGLTFLMFLSGIFYDYRSIAPEWQTLFLMNPMAFLLKCYREVLIEGVLPDLILLGIWGCGGVLACAAIFLVYNSLRYVFPRVVLE